MTHPAILRLREVVADRPRPTPQAHSMTVIKLVAADFDMKVEDLTGRDHTAPTVRARYAAMAVLKAARPQMSSPKVGTLFNRDHTTVLSAYRRVRAWMAQDLDYGRKVQRLIDAVAPRPEDTPAGGEGV